MPIPLRSAPRLVAIPVRWLVIPIVAAALGLLAAWSASAGAEGRVRGSAWLAARLDPRLASWAESGTDARIVSVEFSDKAPGGPVALARGLAEAEASLTPRALARRRRARVSPLVDARDLPVAPEYLASLRSLGLEPFAVSRWLNRAAVRARPEQLESIARLEGVAAIAAVPVRIAASEAPDRTPVTVAARADRAVATRGRSVHGIVDPGIAAVQLAQIGLPALHAAGYDGTGMLIAILDQGFNFYWKHDALRSIPFAPGHLRDFVDGDTTVADTTSLFNFRHGAWVLGVLGGNLPGVYLGSAFGASFALARTEIGAAEVPEEMLYWAQAAEWADSLGVDIVSSSVGYNVFDDPQFNLAPSDLDGHTSEISRAAEIAASKGILLVNSIGNAGFGPAPRIVAPADVSGDSLIAVGAVDSLGNVSGFSSRGPTADGRIKPDLVARGSSAWLIQGTGQPSAYEQRDGTSFAAPLVAGLAACVMQARPSLAPVDVIRALRETASAMCLPDNDEGWGIPDGPSALGWMPGPPGTNGPPKGYLELANTGANPVRPGEAPMRVRFGLGPRLGEHADARLRVFDASGRLVQSLFYGSLTCGRWQEVEWSGLNHEGRRVRPGVYYVHFDAQGRTQSLRVALLQ